MLLPIILGYTLVVAEVPVRYVYLSSCVLIAYLTNKAPVIIQTTALGTPDLLGGITLNT
jgi:hypothetical protein